MNKLKDHFNQIHFEAFIQSNKIKLSRLYLISIVFLVMIIIFQFFNLISKFIFHDTVEGQFTIDSQGRIEDKKVYRSLNVDPFKSNRLILDNTNLYLEVPPTSLPLSLYGIRYSDKGIANAAILGFDKNNQTIYAINDVIEGDTILESILKDRVVISRGGVRESVAFNDTVLISGLFSSTSEPVKELQNKSINITAQNFISFEPYFTNGTIKGYKVFPGIDEESFNNSGLQSGDLLLAVNGVLVNDPAIEVEMSNFSNQINLNILRGEDNLSLTLELN